jgi:hypothetical protein
MWCDLPLGARSQLPTILRFHDLENHERLLLSFQIPDSQRSNDPDLRSRSSTNQRPKSSWWFNFHDFGEVFTYISLMVESPKFAWPGSMAPDMPIPNSLDLSLWIDDFHSGVLEKYSTPFSRWLNLWTVPTIDWQFMGPAIQWPRFNLAFAYRGFESQGKILFSQLTIPNLSKWTNGSDLT